MNSSLGQVKSYYDANTQTEWDRLGIHPFEFLLTTYMLDKYIKPGDSVLDLGGGPGRYSIYFAQKGCDVTLVDLSDGNIDFAKAKAKEAGVSFQAVASNCLDIESLDLKTFDHVLFMGPLYHIRKMDERVRAVQLALDRLKTGGLLYASFILNFAAIIYDLANGPGYYPIDYTNPESAVVIDDILNGRDYTGPSFTSTYFMHQRNILPFFEQFPLEKMHLFGQEGILALNEVQLKNFPKDELDMWIETAQRLLDVPELLSHSHHAMYIGRKQ